MKKRAFLFCGICMLVLAGCEKRDDTVSSFIDAFVEDSVLKASSIESDEEYEEYERISKDETINEEGYYISEKVDESVLEDVDAVHVTFATNSNISIEYFEDADMCNQINASGAYMHENDCIYANIIEIDNPNTESYEFSEFEVWEFEKDGAKKKKLETESFQDGLVYQIPMDFGGKEITIIPLGKYVTRTVELNDYYKDNNGEVHALGGYWNFNGERTSNNSISCNPVASYAITYNYEPDKYVFVSSDPRSLYVNETEGIVSFEEFSSDQNITSISVELHKKSGDMEFNPSKYPIKHAQITYKYQGAVIEAPIFVPIGSKIEYLITNVEEGYWVPGTMREEIEIENISEKIENLVCKEEIVKVRLPQPEKGGKIIYSYDGKIIDDNSVEVLIGSEIQMNFVRKNGWSCEVADGAKYRVKSKEVQVVNIDGMDVNDVFTEQQYKPVVTFTIDKSVETYTEFSIKAIDVNEVGLKLQDNKKSLEVFKQEVGTKEDLYISTQNGALLDGEALKFVIEKETKEGVKEKDIRYLQKVPDNLKVSLYIADDSSVYNTVNINVSKVNVVFYSCPSVDNGNIVIKTADLTNNRVLKTGDVIEDSREVEVSLVGKDGFYVKDSGKSDIYSDTLKYSKYLKDIESILKKHPVKKLCVITLDATDPYGTVTYKIGGKAVDPGTYKLKEEHKLTIAYEITDGSHEIERDTSNVFTKAWDMIQSNTEESTDISITQALDGRTVTRDMYISVKSK